jgi:hypothetical protein
VSCSIFFAIPAYSIILCSNESSTDFKSEFSFSPSSECLKWWWSQCNHSQDSFRFPSDVFNFHDSDDLFITIFKISIGNLRNLRESRIFFNSWYFAMNADPC